MNNFKYNKLYDILKKLIDVDVSDIHILEWDNMYVRTASWNVQLVKDIIVEKDEIWWFMQDFLSVEMLDSLLDWNEVDAAYSIENVRFRINAYQDKDWIRLALRKISVNPPSLEDIWFDYSIRDYLLKDKWLILVTWPTWSWKSTSLAAMVEFINNNRNCHIITLEDPIEYIYNKKKALITQREIWKNSKSWWNAMKYAMRQDPDVIMVWEMRDLETISAVLTLVETWHLVMSTLHTIDSAQTITRIIDVFPPHQQEQIAVQLSLSLELIISQRLFPNVDNDSRIAAREIMVNTSAIANNIRERRIPQIVSIIETSRKHWMITMDQSLAHLVAEWLLSKEVVISKIKNIDSFNVLLDSLTNEKRVFKPVD